MVLSALFIAGPAQSVNYKSASGGQAYDPADAFAFKRNPYGRIENQAGGGNHWRYWTIDVETRATGTKTLEVYGASSDASNLSTCAGIVTQANGNLTSWTAHEALPTTAAWYTLSPDQSVVAGANVQFECNLSNDLNASAVRGYVSNVRGF